jgi:hypothetical protein
MWLYVSELRANDSVNYEFSSFSDMCRVWDDEKEVWDATSCMVSEREEKGVSCLTLKKNTCLFTPYHRKIPLF